ncbi:hypothetical protein [Agrobacterium larrymoorei]|uniref:Uncharacterized protein n=1 Tax=Agrobacterium larrymoorei TaxID=160699 RepID=A0ABU0UKP1_9HYPH|nr:hypothetical protein [Agrobacterium larrymoorei]MDQ1185378.1 hypothetical protein [Agrobacterium larrymoorei]
MNLIKPIVVVASLTASVSPAFSQTAEETVSFILYGLEDGRKIVQGGTVVATVEQTSSSPATYLVSPSGQLELDQATVRKLENCQFEVIVHSSPAKERKAIYDFSKVGDITFTLGNGLLSFAGKCAIKGSDGSCNSTALISAEMTAPENRVRKAIKFLKANYCAGSAY